MDGTTTGSGKGKTVPRPPGEPGGGGSLGLLLAALGLGAVMGKQVIADLGALAARVRHVRPEAVLLRAVELFTRALVGVLEETAEPLPAGSELRRDIDRAAVGLGKVARRLCRAQELCEPPETAEAVEGEAAEGAAGAADGRG